MPSLHNDRAVISLGITVLAVLVALGFYAVAYSRKEAARLVTAPAYASPRDGMDRWERDHGAIRVEITDAGQEFPLFRSVWFVRADVWSDEHDGPETATRSFLRTPRGWVLIPEGRHAGVIALGQGLLSLVGPRPAAPAISRRAVDTPPRPRADS